MKLLSSREQKSAFLPQIIFDCMDIFWLYTYSIPHLENMFYKIADLKRMGSKKRLMADTHFAPKTHYGESYFAPPEHFYQLFVI